MFKKFALLVFLCFGFNALAQNGKNPSFEEIISLQSRSSAVISPDGKNVVFETQSVDWKENRYDRELWISKEGQAPFQLTNTPKGSSRSAKWSPDGK